MNDAPPVLSYEGGIAGFAATAPPPIAEATQKLANGLIGAASAMMSGLSRNGLLRKLRNRVRFNSRSPLVKSFVGFLKKKQRRAVAQANIDASQIVHSYTYVTNAFTVRLSPAEFERLQSDPAVEDIRRPGTVKAFTSSAMDFLNMPGGTWPFVGGAEHAGEGIVIGVVDTGIWPDHPSFADDPINPYAAPPKTWKGRCNATEEESDDPPLWKPFECNTKLIGAQWFVDGLLSEQDPNDTNSQIDWLNESKSPRDRTGHGTWCAGAAAGNRNVPIMRGSQSLGNATGAAPRAHLAIYKALWNTANGAIGSWADVLAAIDRAVADGVDILSLSIGVLPDSYFDEVPLLNAAKAGVFVVQAAGNNGMPPPNSFSPALISVTPFALTVGASTISRTFPPLARLTFVGKSLYVDGATWRGGDDYTKNKEIVLAVDVKRPGASNSDAEQCITGALANWLVQGKMVICMSGGNSADDKALVVSSAGGAAMLLAPRGPSADPESIGFDFPCLSMTYTDAYSVRLLLKDNGANPTIGTLSPLYWGTSDEAPMVAAISSSGPLVNPLQPAGLSNFTNDILKPDIVAPGVMLFAAAPSPLGEVSFGLLTGTSMATPIVAGVAALVMQKHPTLSPAAIKSAIMTSASRENNLLSRIRNQDESNATPFNFGSGQINPSAAIDPGLIFDITYNEYIAFLYGVNSKEARAQSLSILSTKTPSKGAKKSTVAIQAPAPITAYQLNLPNICVSRLKKSATVVRRVVNVSGKTSKYTLTLEQPDNVKVVVRPTKFTLANRGTQTITVTLTVVNKSSDYSFGRMTWSDTDGHVVSSAIGVQPY
ncbi:hypothetical protein CLOP_g3304 [Closterium sp. NIES-67]|nr:hypothetical protein CLOP_g3304 [Closterium sp. NIES-67]